MKKILFFWWSYTCWLVNGCVPICWRRQSNVFMLVSKHCDILVVVQASQILRSTYPNSTGFLLMPLARYLQLRVAHALGIPRTFSPPPQVSDPDMHHGACLTHVPWCMSGPLTSGFLWSRWRDARCMGNPQFYVSGKRPIVSEPEAWLFPCHHNTPQGFE